MSLSEAIAQFHTQLLADSRSPNTIGSYLNDVGMLTDWLAGDPTVDSITAAQLAEFVASDTVQLKKDGTAKATGSVNKIKASLRAFFGYLVETGELPTSPARALKMKHAPPPPPSILTPAEQKKLLKTVRARKGGTAERDRILLEVLLGTGIRLSSLVALDVEDVQLDDKRMVIEVKGGRREGVFLKSGLRRLLRGHIHRMSQRGEGSGPLFRSNRGSRISRRQVQVRVQHWVAEAEIDKNVTVHGMRHSFGSTLYARTRDLRLVQKALHHRHSTTTEIYAHLADDALEVAVEAM